MKKTLYMCVATLVITGLLVTVSAVGMVKMERGVPDPDKSSVDLTAENTLGMTTCPSGDGPVYQHVKVTCKSVYDDPLPGIPAGAFEFTVENTTDTLWYGTLSCTFTAVDNATDANGEIRFEVVGDTSIYGNITIEVTVMNVDINDTDTLPCITFDYNVDGSVNLIDFGIFAGDFLTTAHRSDFNWDGTVNLIDFGMFASHFLH